jgi:hypothetical protein
VPDLQSEHASDGPVFNAHGVAGRLSIRRVFAMNLFLSSSRLGAEPERFSDLAGAGRRLAFIPNALDLFDDPVREKVIQRGIQDLADLGQDPVLVDLREHFDEGSLEQALSGFGACFVTGETFLFFGERCSDRVCMPFLVRD